MHTDTVKITSDDDSEVVLVLKKKKFPWWFFLFLLPLILLIPIPRDIMLKFVQGNDGAGIPGRDADVQYPAVSTFGTRTPININRKTDNDGQIIITGISEPLWYRIFGSDNDSLHAFIASQCETAAKSLKYKDVPSDQFLIIPSTARQGELQIKVIDASTGKPLPGATVTINGAIDMNATTDDKAIIKIQLPLCSDIQAKGEKEGYTSDSLSIAGFPPTSSPEERTLKLTPIAKPEPPKPEPLKPEPPKQDDLKGKTGDLRFNLQWYCKADLDMIIKDPCGRLTYYDAKRTSCNGSTGILDIDANQNATNMPDFASTTPQENTVWTNPSKGNYTVIIKCCPFHPRMYLSSKKVKFTLTIIDHNGRIDKTGEIGENDSLIFMTHTLKP